MLKAANCCSIQARVFLPSHQGMKFNLILPKPMKGTSAPQTTRTPCAWPVQQRGSSGQPLRVPRCHPLIPHISHLPFIPHTSPYTCWLKPQG